MSGSPYKDLKSGASGTRSKSNLRSGSKVSFLFPTSGSDPASENLQQTSITFNAAADSASDDPISSHLSGFCDMITRSPTQLTNSVPSTPNPNESSSFRTFSMSHSYSQPAKEMYVPRHKASITTTVLSVARTIHDTGLETTDMTEVSGLSPHRSISSFSSESNQLQNYIHSFQLPKEQLLFVKNAMQEALERGLKHNIQGGSSIPVVPTYVCALPDGTGKCPLQ